MQTPCLQDTTHQLSGFPGALVKDQILLIMAWRFLSLTLLLADEKCDSPPLVTSGDPAPGPTSDFFLESEPFEERSLVDNVLILAPVVVHVVTQKCHTPRAVSGLGHSNLIIEP